MLSFKNTPIYIWTLIQMLFSIIIQYLFFQTLLVKLNFKKKKNKYYFPIL